MRVWDLATGTPVGEPLTGHTGAVCAVAVGALDGRPVVITGSGDGTVRVWDLATGTPRRRPAHRPHRRGDGGGGRRSWTAGPRGHRGSGDGTVRVWDLADDREQARWIADGDVLTVAFDTAITVAGDTAGWVHALQLNVPAAAAV